VVVDRHREDPLGALLADDIFIEHALDLGGPGDRLGAAPLIFLGDLVEELVGVADALLADVDPLAADEPQAFALSLAAKDAVEKLFGSRGAVIAQLISFSR